MVKKEKLLSKVQNNPDGLSFDDFETILAQCEWVKHRQEGSHRIWKSPAGFRLSIQERNGKAKGYQVRQFLAQYEKESQHDRSI